jgi:hypothetical protein
MFEQSFVDSGQNQQELDGDYLHHIPVRIVTAGVIIPLLNPATLRPR